MISSDRKGLETDSLDVVTEVQNEVDARLYEMSHHPEVAVLVVLTVKHPESKRLGRGPRLETFDTVPFGLRTPL